MDKKLQDYVWQYCLPKEFKEEVKKIYSSYTNPMAVGFESHIITCEYIFGKHNLTSDAEGEEMLTVSRKRVQDEFNSVKIIASEKICSKVLAGAADMYLKTLERLFGSKCLPDKEEKMTEERYQYLNSLSLEDYDNETSADEQRQFCEYQHKHHPDEVIYFQTHSDEKPKPAEPKFKVGDIVRFKYCCTPYRIDGFKMLDGAMLYHVGEVWAEESDLEPYTEP